MRDLTIDRNHTIFFLSLFMLLCFLFCFPDHIYTVTHLHLEAAVQQQSDLLATAQQLMSLLMGTSVMGMREGSI